MARKMSNQSTDNMNMKNGVDAVGATMRPIPDQSVAVPASKEFNGFEFDTVFSEERRGASA